MNAKKLIKKIATLGIIGVLGTSLIACGGSSSDYRFYLRMF